MNTPASNQIAALRKLGLEDLRAKYLEVFGKETKSRDRKALFSQIARKLQNDEEPESARQPVPLPTLIAKYHPKKEAKGEGKKSRSKKASNPSTKLGTREKGEAKLPDTEKPGSKKREPLPIGARDPRLPKVGTTIEREYKGKKLLVRVLEKGFEYEGKEYRSLSSLAKHISGQIVNGFTWFKLGAKASLDSARDKQESK